jgi:outer membrane receptor protein involved in Fe transport
VNNHFAAQESHDIVNMHVSIRDTEETWSLTFGLKNAFDKKYLLAADSNGGLGYALGVYAQPRNWYLSYETSF